jgi:hypothetical protein
VAKAKKARRPPGPSLTAAASPVEIKADESRKTQDIFKSWQDEAWWMYDALGEFRQGVKWLSNVLSRARLVPAIAPLNPGDEPMVLDPDTDDPAVGLVEDIAMGIGGQSDLLRSATVHLTVPGEGWFIGKVDTPLMSTKGDTVPSEQVSWKFYSRDEVRFNKRSALPEIQVDDRVWVALPDESLLIRVWRPHDRFHWMADSSTRAALPIMRRLELLNRKMDAQIKSRLAMNGVYWVPSEITFPEKDKYADADDPFVAEFMDLMTTAIRTPGSAAASVPFIARAAAEYIEKIRYDEFAKLVDPELIAQREFEIRRLATAMDIPPEVLLGLAGMNHWGAWQVEESALKTTVTSLLELVCWALTTGYLRPALEAMGQIAEESVMGLDAEGNEIEVIPAGLDRIVWYDLSELAVRPDRSQDAKDLHGTLTITDQAALRETGFDENDLLTDVDELKRRLGLKIVSNPQAATLEIGLELLGIETVASVQLGDSNANAGAQPEPGAPEGDLPANDTPQAPPPTNGDTPAPETVAAGARLWPPA